MHEPNILYVNNSKFILIVDNVSVLQLFPGPFYTTENLSSVDGFNSIGANISSVSFEVYSKLRMKFMISVRELKWIFRNIDSRMLK